MLHFMQCYSIINGRVVFITNRVKSFIFYSFTKNPKVKPKMKKLLVIIGFCFLPFISISQESYTINGETIQLKEDVKGSISLLWNIIDGEYRYFVKKDDNVKELLNTKKDNKFQEEYKSLLGSFTNYLIDTNKVNLTLPSLRSFFNDFNKKVDTTYVVNDTTSKLKTNLLIYGGLTNHPLVENSNNQSNPIFGLELEFYNPEKLPKHALFLGVNHALSSDKFDYSSTQFNLGYRFRFINKSSYNIYANTTIVTYSISKEITTYEENNMPIEDEISGSTIDAPFSFGLGADIKLSSFSYLTLSYNELFALTLKNKGNFSTHFNIGYKINL